MKNSVYKMPKKPGPGQTSRYPDELRKQVAETYLTTSYSLNQVSKLFKLPNRALVSGFIRWYKANYDLDSISLDPDKSETSAGSKEVKESTKENEQEKLLRYAKLKIESLEKMIDIAEDQFNIDIRKKSGAKSSKK